MTIEEIINYLKELSSKDKGIILCNPERKCMYIGQSGVQAILWVNRVYHDEDDLYLLVLKEKLKQIMIANFGAENPDILNCQKWGYICSAWGMYDRVTKEVKNEIIEHLAHLKRIKLCGMIKKFELKPEIYITNTSDLIDRRVFLSDSEINELKSYMYFDDGGIPASVQFRPI